VHRSTSSFHFLKKGFLSKEAFFHSPPTLEKKRGVKKKKIPEEKPDRRQATRP